jgi:hypothetical protein
MACLQSNFESEALTNASGGSVRGRTLYANSLQLYHGNRRPSTGLSHDFYRLLPLPSACAVFASAARFIEPQEVFASYGSSELEWETQLQMKNNLASGSLTVKPVLRWPSGKEIALDPVAIASNASASVFVDEGLPKHARELLLTIAEFV